MGCISKDEKIKNQFSSNLNIFLTALKLMIPKVFSCRNNKISQTDVSVFGENCPFNFENDEEMKYKAEMPKIRYTDEMVENIIRPLTIASDGSVVNHHIPRLFKRRTAPMIQNLIEQIDMNPSGKDELVRQMAAALIPGLINDDYQSLFTHPIQLPYAIVDTMLQVNGSLEGPKPFTAIFSLDGTLSLINDTDTYQCKIELWDRIEPGREINLIMNDQSFGRIRILEQVEPITFERVPRPLYESIGFDAEDKLIEIIRPDDTSFIDVVLSIPSLAPKDANDLLAILHSKKLLSPYLRSKVCALQLVDPTQPRNWPELLGRFMFLLDPKWTYANLPLLRNNDVMAIFRHIKDMKGGALYVLQTALFALDEIKGSDPIIFFWTLIFMSLLQNATLANPEHAVKLKNKMMQMWKELQKKAADSNTRKLTREIIDHVKNIRQFQLGAVVHQELEFIKLMLIEHKDEIFKIMAAIPYRREESHPLYFPVVLALETAIVQARRHEDFITSESESMTGDFETSTSVNSKSKNMLKPDDSDNSVSSRRNKKLNGNASMKSDNEIHTSVSAGSRSKKPPPKLQESVYNDDFQPSGLRSNTNAPVMSKGVSKLKNQKNSPKQGSDKEDHKNGEEQMKLTRVPPKLPSIKSESVYEEDEEEYASDDLNE